MTSTPSTPSPVEVVPAGGAQLVQLRAAGACAVLDVAGPQLPRVLHWGADLGALDPQALAALARASVPPVPGSSFDDPGALLHGVVATDAGEALFAYVRLATSPDALPGRVRLPGLDRARSYTVAVRDDVGSAAAARGVPPAWATAPITLPGAVLVDVGLPMPSIDPAEAVLLQVTAAPSSPSTGGDRA